MGQGVSRIVLCAGVCLLAAGAGAAGPDEEPLVRVNGYVISRAELGAYRRLFEAGTGGDESAVPLMEREQLEALRDRRALGTLIDRRMLYDVARDEYVGGLLTPEIMDAIAEEGRRALADRLGGRIRLARFLSEATITEEQFKDLYVQDWLVSRLLQDKVYSRLSVSPAEVGAHYDEHRDEFRLPRTVAFRQVLFVVADAADEVEQRGKAEGALRQIEGGADFGAVADACSDDGASYPGGVHEVPVPDDAGAWLPAALEGLAPGQTSGVRRVPGGLAIVRFEEDRPPRVAPFEHVQGRIKQTLLARRQAAALAEYLGHVREEARVEYHEGARRLGLPPGGGTAPGP